MADRRTCPKPKGCGRRFTPRRGTRRVYCYACRPEVVTAGPESMEKPPAADDEPGVLTEAVTAELARVKESGSVVGAVALRLARALDDPELGAAQVASLSAQLMRIMEPLRAKGPKPTDALDEFTARLLEKQAKAS